MTTWAIVGVVAVIWLLGCSVAAYVAGRYG
jgi:hypothetical protein